MQTAKQDVAALLEQLPEGGSLADVQYRPHVIGKIRRGLDRAESGGTLSQVQAEARPDKWLVNRSLVARGATKT
ncbi:hypothetical protein [Thiobacillus sp.]